MYKNNTITEVLGVGAKALQLFIKVSEKYGTSDFIQSYRGLGKEFDMAYTNVRYHFQKLEKYGYLTIDKANRFQFVFHLNEDKLKGLLK